METLLWDVDTQKDFVEEDGRLAVEGAPQIRNNLARITEHARDEGLRIWGSSDYHTEDDPEISDDPDFESTFPPHCLENTDGWRRIEETSPEDPLWIDSEELDRSDLENRLNNHPDEVFFRKQEFDVFSNPTFFRSLSTL